MHTFLVIVACLIVALGLRMSSIRSAKKLGAFVFILSMVYLGYRISDHWLGAVIGGGIWLLLPLIEIYTKRSKESYPLSPSPLASLPEVNESFFPYASAYRSQLDELGFDAVDNLSWRWLETHQHHRFFWNPELNTIASVCLCELEKIAFTFVIFHSELADGTVLRTTNYPFTSPLIHPPKTHWKHVPCEEKHLPTIFQSHQSLIAKHNVKPCALVIPDPDKISEKWTREYSERIQYNLSKKLIKADGELFKFTPLGYFHLWVQAVRDFIRLC